MCLIGHCQPSISLNVGSETDSETVIVLSLSLVTTWDYSITPVRTPYTSVICIINLLVKVRKIKNVCFDVCL